MTTEELRAAYQQDFATVQASVLWLRMLRAQQGRLRALALFCARATDDEMSQLLALISSQPQREEQAMAATKKLTSENDLTDDHKRQLEAAGIDWQTFIQKLGPLAIQLLQIILGSLAGKQLQGKKQAVKAGCCDHHACCQEVLSSALQTAALAADHCCQCCEEQQECQP